MNEFSKKPEVTDTKKPETENFMAIKPESDISAKEARSFLDERFEDKVEQKEGYYTTLEDRMNRIPLDGERGQFEGERGESKFVPSGESEAGQAAKEKLAERGMTGIEYKNAEPDFSPCSEATVKIDNMTENRYDYNDMNGDRQSGNFSQADIKCAEQWSSETKDGKSDWTPRDVYDWRHENGCSWHECCDTKTMQLVPQEIHSFFRHSGGVAECKARDNNRGGDFDE